MAKVTEALLTAIKENKIVYLQLEGSCSSYDGKFLRLYVSGCDKSEPRLNANDMKPLAEALLLNHTIEKLDLSCNQIGNNGAQYLANVIEKHPSLKELDLCSNELTDEGIGYIAQATAKSKTLTRLDIRYNQYPHSYGPQAAKYLGEMLKVNRSLKILDMHVNNAKGIGNEGACYLAEGLKQNTTLESLIVWNQNIGDEGAKAFNDALTINKTLKDLQLMGNPISESILQEIKQKLAANQQESKKVIPSESQAIQESDLTLSNVITSKESTISDINTSSSKTALSNIDKKSNFAEKLQMFQSKERNVVAAKKESEKTKQVGESASFPEKKDFFESFNKNKM